MLSYALFINWYRPKECTRFDPRYDITQWLSKFAPSASKQALISTPFSPVRTKTIWYSCIGKTKVSILAKKVYSKFSMHKHFNPLWQSTNRAQHDVNPVAFVLFSEFNNNLLECHYGLISTNNFLFPATIKANWKLFSHTVFLISAIACCISQQLLDLQCLLSYGKSCDPLEDKVWRLLQLLLK